MNLSNSVEFDNLTLNCSVGTKWSVAGCFSFTHLLYFWWFSPGVKNIDLAERFLNNNRFSSGFFILLFWICKLLHFVLKMIICIAIVEKHPKNLNNYINLKNWKPKTELFIAMHFGIVLDFILPKSAINCRIIQHCLIGKLACTDG